MKKRLNELAPCGVFCRACPSFDKTCLGCASESKNQKRTSKWGCAVRNCCYSDKTINYCIECNDFPCKIINKKLIDTHPNDIRFKYRHEIPEVFAKMKEMKIENYLEFQKERWSCPNCGSIVHFYKYKCSNCGEEVII